MPQWKLILNGPDLSAKSFPQIFGHLLAVFWIFHPVVLGHRFTVEIGTLLPKVPLPTAVPLPSVAPVPEDQLYHSRLICCPATLGGHNQATVDCLYGIGETGFDSGFPWGGGAPCLSEVVQGGLGFVSRRLCRGDDLILVVA